MRAILCPWSPKQKKRRQCVCVLLSVRLQAHLGHWTLTAVFYARRVHYASTLKRVLKAGKSVINSEASRKNYLRLDFTW